jgi:MarR family 2-MHQ and catechol resistance regulon transcriptional repressor
MGESSGSVANETVNGVVNGVAERDWGDDEERALRLWIALARCYSTMSREVATKVGDYGLTTPQFGVLEALYHLGPLPLGELADKLLVTGGNITYVMDRLAEQGLVERIRSKEDRRVVLACLTAEGQELVGEVFPDHAEFVCGQMSALEAEEQETLRDLLKKLGKSLG